MQVSDLQTKDIVSVKDGKRLGRITDIDIDTNGLINYFVVEPRRFFRFFSSNTLVNVSIKDIQKIGEDVILVEI